MLPDGVDVLVEGWEDELGPFFFPEEEIYAARRRGDVAGYNEDPGETDDSDGDDDNDNDNADDEDVDMHDDTTAEGLAYDVCGLDLRSQSTSGSSDLVSPTSMNDTGNMSKPQRGPYTCPLCLEIPVRCTSTRCGHAFCASLVQPYTHAEFVTHNL
jgi:hypothetical protein